LKTAGFVGELFIEWRCFLFYAQVIVLYIYIANVLFTQRITITVVILKIHCVFIFLQLELGSSLSSFKEEQQMEKLAKIKTKRDVCEGFFGGT